MKTTMLNKVLKAMAEGLYTLAALLETAGEAWEEGAPARKEKAREIKARATETAEAVRDEIAIAIEIAGEAAGAAKTAIKAGIAKHGPAIRAKAQRSLDGAVRALETGAGAAVHAWRGTKHSLCRAWAFRESIVEEARA